MDGEKLLLSLLCLLSLPVVVSTGCPTSPFTNTNGYINSPGFSTNRSSSYGDNLTCTYRIMVPANRRVILEFKRLSVLGTMPNCEEDSLEILVGCKNESIGKFCSCSELVMPYKIYSLDNCMTLIFKSDGSKRAEGFEAEYTSMDNNTKVDPDSNCSSTDLLGSSNGTFFTPNWPLTYPSDFSCSWTFGPPSGKIVRLFYMSFEMEGDAGCEPNRPSFTADEIRINGTNSTGGKENIVPRLCAKPRVLYRTIKQMKTILVRFKSNQAREFSGVIAGYATYRNGELNSTSPGCRAFHEPSATPTATPTATTTSKPITTKIASGKQTLARSLVVVGATILAAVVFL